MPTLREPSSGLKWAWIEGGARGTAPVPMEESLVGRMLGVYRIERALGQGGMGAVYVGRHARTGRPYAVKVLLREHAGQKDALQRFRREAEALSALGHAHIVAIHDYDETPDGLSFLVMDLLEGEDLAHRLSRGRMDWRAAIALLDPIASAIEMAHGVGLIHRDLKPSNVFLARPPGGAERPMLLDFGLARAFDEDAHARQGKLTATGTVMGTPSYMSPEQAQGTPLDGRSDLWALGILLFEMIAGRPPFDGPTLTSTLVAVMTSPRPRLNDRGIPVPEALEAVLDRALEKQPDDRYPDVASFRAALRQIALSPETMPAGPLPRTSGFAIAGTQATPLALTAENARPAANTPGPTLAHPDPSARPRSETAPLWVALGLAFLFALGSGGVLLAFVLQRTTSTTAVVAAPPTLPESVPSTPSADAPSVSADAGPADARSEATEATETSETSETRPARGRERRPNPVTPSEAVDEAEAPVGEGAAPSARAGGPPPELLRAVDRMSAGDYRGCLRELEHAGNSVNILGARMNCADRANDTDALREVCALFHRHHPEEALTRACDAILATH